MNFIKRYLPELLFVYGLFCLATWLVRLFAFDCSHRYIDYVAPITKLHCEIK